MTDIALGPGGADPAPAAHARRHPGDDAGPAARRLVALALVTGFALQSGLRGGVTNAVVAIGLALVVAALLTDRRVQRREARLLAIAALVPVAFLAVRTSPWLALSNLAAAAALMGASVLYSRSGSVLDTTIGRMLQRSLAAVDRGLSGLGVVRFLVPRLSPPGRGRAVRVARAALVTVPVVWALTALLASADAVFASFLAPDVNVGPVAAHVVLTLCLAPSVLMIGAAAVGPVADRPRTGGFGAAEVATMLGLVAAVLGLFVVAQLVALTEAGDRLVREAGLTPAEYARGGFFQLCSATGLLLAFLGVVRALASPVALARGAVRLLGAAVPLLAVGLVVVSLRRMALYDQAFGLTMLRLWVVGAAVWMGLVLVMAAMRAVRPPDSRDWVVAAAGASAVALVLVADVAGAEAFVVRHNLDRARDGAELDTAYLSRLSDDAVPAIAARIGTTGDEAADHRLALAVCGDDAVGVAALNLAVARAADAREDVCPADIPQSAGHPDPQPGRFP